MIIANPWRVHLSNQAIQELQILSGRQTFLAVWTKDDHVQFYELSMGRMLGERLLPAPPFVDADWIAWESFASMLVAHDNVTVLPVVYTPNKTIYSTDDGKMRLFREDGTVLTLQTNHEEIFLDAKGVTGFIELDFDRVSGITAALDEQGKLHIFQQTTAVGVYDIGFELKEHIQPSLTLTRGAGCIYAANGRKVKIIGLDGTVLHCIETYYQIDKLACAPDGEYIVTSDIEYGLLRVYRGDDLRPVYQKFGIDLIASANQVQLLADLPPVDAAISALTVYVDGIIAFAMSGVACVTDISQMDRLPTAGE